MPRFNPGAATGLVVCWGLGWAVWAGETPEELLNRFRTNMKDNLERLPDYTCATAIERFTRPDPERAWERIDELKLEVAMVGATELYARAGARRFQARPLSQMVNRGTIGTGQFGMLARHVFLSPAVKFGYEREVEVQGRPAQEFHYELAAADSQYKLRSASVEAVTPISGVFQVDPQTLDLLRLEVRAFDIPESLGLAEVVTVLNYTRQPVGSDSFLLPSSGTLHLSSGDGMETLNRIRLTACRRYQVESSLVADAVEAVSVVAPPEPKPMTVAPGTVFEVSLDSPIDVQRVQPGEPVQARVVRIKGAAGSVPQGSRLSGRVVGVERELTESPVFHLSLEFDSLESAGTVQPLSATMENAGPAAGLIRQAKRLDPTFQKNSRGQLNLLVREVRRGQGVLLWEARHGPIPQGLKMTWRVTGDRDPD